MNEYEKLAILTALQKVVKQSLDEVREKIDGEFAEELETEGIEKRALIVNHTKVGEITATYFKPDFEVTYKPDLDEFALTYGFAHYERTIRPESMPAVLDLLEAEMPEAIKTDVKLDSNWKTWMTDSGDAVTYLDSGMVVPGVELRPHEYKGTRVTGCKPEAVIPQVRLMGGLDRLLLGDGNE